MMMTELFLLACLALPAPLGGFPWDKPPAKWDISDVYRILQDSPWSPASVKLEVKSKTRAMDSGTGQISDARANPNDVNVIPGMQISRTKPQPDVPVFWWSSKTIRLARLRLRQLRNPTLAKQPLQVDDLPDYVLVIEGSEQLRILEDPAEDLHDSVFLELPGGSTLDLSTVSFFGGSDDEEPRVEFHFPKQIDGQPTLDADADHVILHCKVSAKTPNPARNNALSFRAEFHLHNMQVRGSPDL
jgi:hypothetical protein